MTAGVVIVLTGSMPATAQAKIRATVSPATLTPPGKATLRISGTTARTCRLQIRMSGQRKVLASSMVKRRLTLRFSKQTKPGVRVFKLRCGGTAAQVTLRVRAPGRINPPTVTQTETTGAGAPASSAPAITPTPRAVGELPTGVPVPATPTPTPRPTAKPTAVPTPTPAPVPQRVDAYGNYGGANAGHAMCRGNPGRPESIPGGKAIQYFTVPFGVATIDTALVQIDPDSAVNVTAILSINGAERARASASAAGDTRFNFPSTRVAPGDQAALQIEFSASFGKIITIYTAGAPGGTLVISNLCPDGAPSLTTGSTGLRAVVSGSNL